MKGLCQHHNYPTPINQPSISIISSDLFPLEHKLFAFLIQKSVNMDCQHHHHHWASRGCDRNQKMSSGAAVDETAAYRQCIRPCKSFPTDASSTTAVQTLQAPVHNSQYCYLASWSGNDGAISKPSTAPVSFNAAKTPKTTSPSSSASISDSLRRFARIRISRYSSTRMSHQSSEPSPSVYGKETWIDPPCLANPDMEWVWFPAGYWAARETMTLPHRDTGGKIYQWDTRSTKKIASRNSDEESPTCRTLPAGTLQLKFPEAHKYISPESPSPIQSPYRSEEAHVQSLQTPRPFAHLSNNVESTGGLNTGVSFQSQESSRFPFPLAPLTMPQSTEVYDKSPAGSKTLVIPTMEELVSGQSTRPKVDETPDIGQQPTAPHTTLPEATKQASAQQRPSSKYKRSFMAKLRPPRTSHVSTLLPCLFSLLTLERKKKWVMAWLDRNQSAMLWS